MRLWSLHPCHLDAKGLVALWREGLLARKVLQNRTKGYKRHPQLQRFRACARPMEAIDAYLSWVLLEAGKRGYHFDKRKIRQRKASRRLSVKKGQLAYEWEHLGVKLKRRNPARYKLWKIDRPRLHPLFRLQAGGVEAWEKLE